MKGSDHMEIKRITAKSLPWFLPFMSGKPEKSEEALGLIIDGVPAGAAVFLIDDEICTLREIYIHEEYRKKGGASLLLKSAIEALSDAGVTHMLVYYPEDEALDALFRSSGFTIARTDNLYSIKVSDLIGSEKAKKLMEKGRNKSKVTILSRLKPDELKALTVLIRNSGFSPSLLDKDISDPELSIVSVKGDSVRGVILIGHHGDDLTVPLIINDDDRSLESAALFAALCAQLSHEEFQDKRIYYVPANEKINELLVWLLGEESSIRKEQTLNTGLLLLNENR